MADPQQGQETGLQLVEGIGNEVLFTTAALGMSLFCLLFYNRGYGERLLQRNQGQRVQDRPQDRFPQNTDSDVGPGAEHREGAAVNAGAPAVPNRTRPSDESEDTDQIPNNDLVHVEVKAIYSDTGRETTEARQVMPATTVEEVKSLFFGDALEEGKHVRVVFQGRELANDVTVALCSPQLQRIVLHAVVSASRRQDNERRNDEDELQIDRLLPYLLMTPAVAGWVVVLYTPYGSAMTVIGTLFLTVFALSMLFGRQNNRA